MRRKLQTIDEVRRAAQALLLARGMPCNSLQIDETAGFYGVRSPHCRMILARCNGRVVYCRAVKEENLYKPR